MFAWLSWFFKFLSWLSLAVDGGWADSWLICASIDATLFLAWLSSWLSDLSISCWPAFSWLARN